MFLDVLDRRDLRRRYVGMICEVGKTRSAVTRTQVESLIMGTLGRWILREDN